MRIAVIGAGITGLTLAHLLNDTHEVVIFEKDDEIGGIAKVKNLNDVPYHLVGGHCFNSKSKKVLDFVFKIMPEQFWHKVKRKANICIKNYHIDYPIEFSIKQIYSYDPDSALKIINDYFCASGVPQKETSMDSWFRCTFGNYLSELYFLPYNKKIWGMDLKLMRSSWVSGKLPVPDKKAFIQALFENKEDDMVHSSFFYPKNPFEYSLVKMMAKGKMVYRNCPVISVEKAGKSFLINGLHYYDKIISTMPLNKCLKLFSNVPDSVVAASNQLRYNKLTTMLWETSGVDSTWTYFPESSTIFHRHIHIGNFMLPNKNYTITESIGAISYEKMVNEGRKFDYLLRPLDYYVSDYAYVVYDEYRESSVKILKNYLLSQGVYTCGRFAEWEYYNMDACIQSAMNVADLFHNPGVQSTRRINGKIS